MTTEETIQKILKEYDTGMFRNDTAVGDRRLKLWLMDSIATILTQQKAEFKALVEEYFDKKIEPYKYFSENYEKLMKMLDQPDIKKESLTETIARISEMKQLTRYKYDLINKLEKGV